MYGAGLIPPTRPFDRVWLHGEVQRKIEIQLDLLIKFATLVFEHLNNSSNISQPSNSENLPSQPLPNPWGHIEEVEEENEAQVAEDVDQKVEDNDKEPKGMEIVHSASSEVTPSKLPSEFQFEWLHNNRAKVGAFSLRKHFGPWQFQKKLRWRNHVWDLGKNYKSHHFWGVITCVGDFRDLLSMNWDPLETTKFKHWWGFKDEFKHKPP
ncbi:hypothetical protein PIB30_024686 [Stylosanthes scabra]|uniref:Uncharacterized protein n=1 Tax=Stylosanthes scabra TaxID=79078 RepID=A0ABU6Z8W3_9FABA|nr:hypothetical protein [Stylosanthes scabra]